jgi:uncharacterized membrane protein
MSPAFAILLTFGIGFVAGLRTMTAPAVVAWAVHLGWINLHGSHLNFMGSMWTVTLFTLAALGEYIVDTLPGTPARTSPPALTARICTAMLTGACVGFAGGAAPLVGGAVGALGAVAGAFGGYETRKRLVRALNVRDLMIAIPEDLIAVGLAIIFCYECLRFRTALANLAIHIHSKIS